jgi:soluble lytic murein transglycosylase
MRRFIIGIVTIVLVIAVAFGFLYYHTSRYDDIIGQAAARNGLDFYLVKALIFEESWFRPDIRGASGELGLMQVTRAAASDFALKKGFPPLYEERLIEPELNLEIGCWYLQRSLEHYKNSPAPVLFALLRYNAGESRSDNWLRLALSSTRPKTMAAEAYYLSLVDFPKTRAYARHILQRARNRNFFF